MLYIFRCGTQAALTTPMPFSLNCRLGARIYEAPQNFSWTYQNFTWTYQNFTWAYEFAVEDPDGHVLALGLSLSGTQILWSRNSF